MLYKVYTSVIHPAKTKWTYIQITDVNSFWYSEKQRVEGGHDQLRWKPPTMFFLEYQEHYVSVSGHFSWRVWRSINKAMVMDLTFSRPTALTLYSCSPHSPGNMPLIKRSTIEENSQFYKLSLINIINIRTLSTFNMC